MLTPPSVWINPPAECIWRPWEMMVLWMVMFDGSLPLMEKVSSSPHDTER